MNHTFEEICANGEPHPKGERCFDPAIPPTYHRFVRQRHYAKAYLNAGFSRPQICGRCGERIDHDRWELESCYGTEPTEKQITKAKEILERAGYSVMPPPCPECKGYGFVSVPHTFPGGGGISQGPCPRGCPPPMLYNTNGGQALEVSCNPLVGVHRNCSHDKTVQVTEARAAGTRYHPL